MILNQIKLPKVSTYNSFFFSNSINFFINYYCKIKQYVINENDVFSQYLISWYNYFIYSFVIISELNKKNNQLKLNESEGNNI